MKKEREREDEASEGNGLVKHRYQGLDLQRYVIYKATSILQDKSFKNGMAKLMKVRLCGALPSLCGYLDVRHAYACRAIYVTSCHPQLNARLPPTEYFSSPCYKAYREAESGCTTCPFSNRSSSAECLHLTCNTHLSPSWLYLRSHTSVEKDNETLNRPPQHHEH